jgi:hypothetical protein
MYGENSTQKEENERARAERSHQNKETRLNRQKEKGKEGKSEDWTRQSSHIFVLASSGAAVLPTVAEAVALRIACVSGSTDQGTGPDIRMRAKGNPLRGLARRVFFPVIGLANLRLGFRLGKSCKTKDSLRSGANRRIRSEPHSLAGGSDLFMAGLDGILGGQR